MDWNILLQIYLSLVLAKIILVYATTPYAIKAFRELKPRRPDWAFYSYLGALPVLLLFSTPFYLVKNPIRFFILATEAQVREQILRKPV